MKTAIRKPRKIEGAKPMVAEEKLPEEVLARFILKDVGYVDIKDADTFGIAKAYFKSSCQEWRLRRRKKAKSILYIVCVFSLPSI